MNIYLKTSSLCLCMLVACGPQKNGPDDAGEDSHASDLGTNTIICEDLDSEELCAGEKKCVSVSAQPFNPVLDCFDKHTFVSCVSAEPELPCNNGEIGFFNKDNTCWYQSGRCAPISWYANNTTPCNSKEIRFCDQAK